MKNSPMAMVEDLLLDDLVPPTVPSHQSVDFEDDYELNRLDLEIIS